MTTSEERWDIFSRRFNNSREAVFKVAQYIWREKCLTVTIPAMELAPNVSNALNYIDQGDIICHVPNGKDYVIEVKGNTHDFTSAEDYKYKRIIINEVGKAHRINAFAYFVVNRNLTHACIVKSDTMDQWEVDDVYDKYLKTSAKTYFAPISVGEFIKL